MCGRAPNLDSRGVPLVRTRQKGLQMSGVKGLLVILAVMVGFIGALAAVANSLTP